MKKAKALILTTAGINCDFETQAALNICGARSERVHLHELISKKNKLQNYDILVFPGGFSYGDDIASGKILAYQIKDKLKDEILKFAQSKKLIIGICNGFQALVKMGLLPDEKTFKQSVTLYYNDSGKFECRWVYLKTNPQNNCIWTKNLPEIICLPIAHGEGKFITKDEKILKNLKKNNQVVFKYCDAKGDFGKYPICPNGSQENIAAISNSGGNIFGLMPHPERFIFALQSVTKKGFDDQFGWGKIIFENAVNYIG
ncbi:MAG: phosphoribosylformylglycinamidine synthase I [Elusimicrobiota bacterium]|jgi:phosphoribosylformylglycinamidine synthase|nr:phosphoribosylformylglycinamidine synthase I [Elusimicrobiota bacterium]